jgi:hypothetical protein
MVCQESRSQGGSRTDRGEWIRLSGEWTLQGSRRNGRREVRSSRAAQRTALLDALIRRPRQLERDVDTPALAILREAAVRLKRDARARCLRYDRHEFLSFLKVDSLLQIHLLHRDLVAVAIELALIATRVDRASVGVTHQPPLAAGHLCDPLRSAELIDEKVQRVLGHLQLVELCTGTMHM